MRLHEGRTTRKWDACVDPRAPSSCRYTPHLSFRTGSPRGTDGVFRVTAGLEVISHPGLSRFGKVRYRALAIIQRYASNREENETPQGGRTSDTLVIDPLSFSCSPFCPFSFSFYSPQTSAAEISRKIYEKQSERRPFTDGSFTLRIKGVRVYESGPGSVNELERDSARRLISFTD